MSPFKYHSPNDFVVNFICFHVLHNVQHKMSTIFMMLKTFSCADLFSISLLLCGIEYIAKNHCRVYIAIVTGICSGSQGNFFCQTRGNPVLGMGSANERRCFILGMGSANERRGYYVMHVWCQAINWTNTALQSIVPFGMNFRQIWIKIQQAITLVSDMLMCWMKTLFCQKQSKLHQTDLKRNNFT